MHNPQMETPSLAAGRIEVHQNHRQSEDITTKKISNLGASPDDWTHFDLVLGLACDLLPVVSNSDAQISPDSKIKEIGKTPSRYNRERNVVGIPGWTGYQSSFAEIDRWANEPDYGICLQTRTVRALDIDVPDVLKAEAITAFISDFLDQVLPTRFRNNSGKVLLAFALPGEMPKRKIVVDGGIVEFLATGQQFIAVGTHPSGARYEWAGGLPCVMPLLEIGAFESLWSALVERFAIEDVKSGGVVSPRKRGEHVAMSDPVAEYLLEGGRVLGEDRDGALIVVCPWEADHSTGHQGDGSTVWFPAGTNGYDRGHFKCLHGHCEGRGDTDFFEAVGYIEDVASEFDVIEVREGDLAPLPGFVRTKAGAILATKENVALALSRPDICGWQLRHDDFRDEIMLSPQGTDEWRTFKDNQPDR